eukprot:SAG31_NODE_1025_length_10289_cov_3.290677_8_plen_80_part_00
MAYLASFSQHFGLHLLQVVLDNLQDGARVGEALGTLHLDLCVGGVVETLEGRRDLRREIAYSLLELALPSGCDELCKCK